MACEVLSRARKMAARGLARDHVEQFLEEGRLEFLEVANHVQADSPNELVDDMIRALRHTNPNSEVLGALVVLAAISGEIIGRGVTSFKTASISATQKVRAEIREHCLIGVCDLEEIRMGAELALHSLQPVCEPFRAELLAA